jgi:conjugal transfer/entry exclusion protein
MRLLTRRGLLAAVAGGVLVGLVPAPAAADLWGADLGPLTTLVGQSVTQIAQFASMISQFASMLAQMIAMVNLMKTELSALKSGDLMALLSFVETAQMGYRELTGGVQSMAYTMGQIDGDFKRLYSKNTSSIPFQQRDQVYNQWNTEILAASLVAARQQTVLATLDAQAAQANTVLEHSQNASGEVAQLQAVVEMLRLMEGQLITINQSLASAGRVLADIAASDASNRQLSRGKKQSSLANYTSRGAPVNVPHRLP